MTAPKVEGVHRPRRQARSRHGPAVVPPQLPPPQGRPGPHGHDGAAARRQILRQRQAGRGLHVGEARMGQWVDRAPGLVTAEISDSVSRHGGPRRSSAWRASDRRRIHLHAPRWPCALMVALARQIGMNDAQAAAWRAWPGCCTTSARPPWTSACPLAVLSKPGKLTDDEVRDGAQPPRPKAGRPALLQGGGVDRGRAGRLPALPPREDRRHGLPPPPAGRTDHHPGAHGRHLRRVRRHHLGLPYTARLGPAESLRRMAEVDARPSSISRLFQAFVMKSLGIYPWARWCAAPAIRAPGRGGRAVARHAAGHRA